MAKLNEGTRLSRALNDIDRQMHANLGSAEILQAALDGFVRALDADAGDIKLLESDAWIVSFERGFGPDEIGKRLALEEAPVAVEVARQGEPVVIEDYQAQERIPYVGFPAEHGLRSVIALPLVVRGSVVGCLFAWMREPRSFTDDECDFAKRMAASVALALANARLYQAEHQARERAEAAEAKLALELARTQVLLRASDELTSTVDTDELLERLALVVLEATGISRGFVNLIDQGRGVLIPKVATGGLKAVGGSEIRLEDLSWTAFNAIQHKTTCLLDYDTDDLPDRDREIAESNEARLVLFVPLLHQGEIIGHISLDQPGERYPFAQEQIRIVESIAAVAAVALQNASRYEREHHIAETLQQAMMVPPEEIEAVEIALAYRPASRTGSVGGDFYDVFELHGDRVAIAVGDVAGKGIRAAQTTALMRDGLRAYLLDSGDPSDCFTRLNTLAYRFTPEGKFATAFLGVFDRTTGRLTYCNGGHPAPAVIGPDGIRSLDSHSPILGAFEQVAFSSCEDTLAVGEVLVVVTDGVTEARGASGLFGDHGMHDSLRRLSGTPVADLPDALLSDVIEFAGGPLSDDVVVLCVSRAAVN